MPDEPTKRAGDGEGRFPKFRGGVERVDEQTSGVPPERSSSEQTPERPASVPSEQDPPERSSGASSEHMPGSPPAQPSPGQTSDVAPERPSSEQSSAVPPAQTSPERTSGVPPIPPRQPVARPPATPADTESVVSPPAAGPTRSGRVRARKVRRIVRHIEPWSVLKISLLFYAALFLIVCVASVILWVAARSAGTVDNVESFITSVGGFGNCEPIDGAAPVTTTTSVPVAAPTTPVDQIDPGGTEVPTTLPGGPAVDPSDDEDCRPGEQLVGEFKFEDVRIFQAFALGGLVLVLAGSATNVVMVLLFNLMSDLTGGVRVTVLEEDGPARAAPGSGSPGTRQRG